MQAKVKQRPGTKHRPIGYRADGCAIYGYRDDGVQICNSPRTDGSGKLCQSVAVLSPAGRCKKHGGASPRGAASANFKHGKYSSYADVIPERYKQAYEELHANPEQLLSLEADLALTRSFLKEQVANLDLQLDELSIDRLRAIASEMHKAIKIGGKDELYKLRSLAELVIQMADIGVNQSAKRKEIAALQGQYTRMLETELKRVESAVRSIAVTDVASILGDLLQGIRERVTDRQDLVYLVSLAEGTGEKIGVKLTTSSRKKELPALASNIAASEDSSEEPIIEAEFDAVPEDTEEE
jgi:hypothetical protein